MRHFLVTKNGIARYMLCLDGIEAAAVIAKWHPDDQAQVTAIREIQAADLPADHDVYLRDAWEDDGGKIVVNMAKARAAFETHLTNAKRGKAVELLIRETAGENVAAEKAALQAINPRNLANGQATVADLKEAWPKTVWKS